MKEKKILLSEKEMPEAWYNLQADLPFPSPPLLHPKTLKPLDPKRKSQITPQELIKQEFSQERWIEIPSEVKEVYRIWRPTPLKRAWRLERELKTPARIYYKNESVSPTGSFKPNTAVAQAYYNKKEGVKRIAIETGAGQWGSAMAFACKLFGLECTVYMVKVSYEQKPYRRIMMQTWGAEVYPSPTDKTDSGRKILEQDPDTTGSIGISASEAIEDARTHDEAKYADASVLNHVILHQTIIGLETKKQFKLIGDYPDIIMGCVGGGSNFSGLISPFVIEKLKGKEMKFIACESMACPSLTRGLYHYDYGNTARLGAVLKMYTLGHTFIPAPVHSGGLRYHGSAPLLSLLINKKIVIPRAFYQNSVFEAAVLFTCTEGVLPAPETAHVIKGAIDEAVKCRETGEDKCILIGFSGHGHLDLSAYDAYLSGKLQDYVYPEEKIKEALKYLPSVGDVGGE